MRLWLALGLVFCLGCASSASDGEARHVQSGKPAASQQAVPVPSAAPESSSAAAAAELEQPSTGESTRKEKLRKLLEYDPADPLGNLEEADRLVGDFAGVTLSEGGPCPMLGAPIRLFADPYRVALTAAGDHFVAAAYALEKGIEKVLLVEVPSEGLPHPLQAIELPVPHPGGRVAPPGLAARDHTQVSVAASDGRGALLTAEVLLGKARSPVRVRRIHEGLDTRFAPAVAHSGGGTIVAFTLGTTPMRLMVARVPVSDLPAQLTDVTPPGLSAAAPTFVSGQSPPLLLALDARAAISHVVRVPFDAEGVPKVGELAAPLGMTASPSQLAAGHNGKRIQVAYMAVGSGATTAVGIIDLDPATPPTALVKGTAYGPLQVSALTLPSGALFAADTPQKPGKDPTHDITLTLNRGSEVPRVSTLRAGPPGARGAALARRSDGVIGLAYTTAEGAYLTQLQCK